MIDSPVVANLHNLKDEKWHPIVFRLSFTPSGMKRYKSVGHHTKGFDTREAALEECRNIVDRAMKEKSFIGDAPKLCVGKDFPWDGEEIPAMTAYFGENEDGETIPLM